MDCATLTQSRGDKAELRGQWVRARRKQRAGRDFATLSKVEIQGKRLSDACGSLCSGRGGQRERGGGGGGGELGRGRSGDPRRPYSIQQQQQYPPRTHHPVHTISAITLREWCHSCTTKVTIACQQPRASAYLIRRGGNARGRALESPCSHNHWS